jgi:GNAT superfamily N-acetyltransferase
MNYHPVPAQNHEQLDQFCAVESLPCLDPETVSQQKADAHWLLTGPTGSPVARCSLWWRATPTYQDRRVGLIGHYGADSPAAAAELLGLACRQLATVGCAMAVGPMDGSTWHNYRLVIERGREPGFFLEPSNPEEWPHHFTGNGFTVLAQYSSTILPDLGETRPWREPRLAVVAAAQGIRIRSLQLDQFESELQQVYAIALASFQDNLLYAHIAEPDFNALYYPIKPYLQPDLILFAEKEGQAIGFIFALPDLQQAQRGEDVDTVILKTVAVHPDHQTAGLGSLLVARCQEIASDLGYRRAIHALMHERNASRKISRRNETQLIRRYALFARKLGTGLADVQASGSQL